MYSDMSRCPQTEAEFTDYFFTLIGRSLEGNANDWFRVLSAQYTWKGSLLTIPPGVGPGVKQPADAPFFGLTQQWSQGPKARIFLPTALPDANGYYTRNIQYIKDTPGGVHGTDFTWTWQYQDGNAYVPVTGAEPTPIPPTPPSSDLEQQVKILTLRVDNLEGRVKTLEEAPPSSGVTMEQVIELIGRTVADGRTQPTGNVLTKHSHQAELPLVIKPPRDVEG